MRKLIPVSVALLLLVAMLAVFNPAQAQTNPQTGEPAPGAVSLIRAYTFYEATALSGDDVTYSSVPVTVQGEDVTKIGAYYAADVFVTADVSGTGWLTVTPQVSVDGVNWADVYYRAVTFDVSGTITVNRTTQNITLSADGTDYLRIALAGERLRFAIGYTGAITPTVDVVLRNN